MDQGAVVRAVEVLASPFARGARDAWLADCLRAVRLALGTAASGPVPEVEDELERLLHLPGDGTGWLRRALDEHGGNRPVPCPRRRTRSRLRWSSCRSAAVSEVGIAALHRLRAWQGALGRAFDDVDTGMAIFTEQELARNICLDELLEEEPERERLHDAVRRHAFCHRPPIAPTADTSGKSSWPAAAIG